MFGQHADSRHSQRGVTSAFYDLSDILKAGTGHLAGVSQRRLLYTNAVPPARSALSSDFRLAPKLDVNRTTSAYARSSEVS